MSGSESDNFEDAEKVKNCSSTRGQSNQDVKQVQTGDQIDDLVYSIQ
jgi:hypothetical protein